MKKCINRSKKNCNSKYILTHKNKCKATWAIISSTVASNLEKTDITSIKFNNLTFRDPYDICNILNNNFIDFNETRTLVSANNTNTIKRNHNTMFLRPIDVEETLRIIKGLKNTTSSGYDDITTKILKIIAPFISRPLTHIINLSFEDGYFPDQLKLTVIKPLHKKNDRTDPNNYRPIALIPIVSKIFEKAMITRLNEFLSKHDILRTEQYGFRKGYSTELACFDFVKSVTEAVNEKVPIMSIFLDMSRAFDVVNHSKLLSKLEIYGIRGKALDWIKSYLDNRKQCTEISQTSKINSNHQIKKTYRSQFKFTRTGVPQGSVLGPLMFLIYINDLPQSINHKCILYADDTTLLIKGNDINSYENDINNTIRDILNWLKNNDLNINITKTNYMQFHSYRTRPLPLTITHDSNKIEQAASVKFLGLHIDSHLNWKIQINSMCDRLDRFVFALRRLRNTVSMEAAITAYYGYVASVLNYGLILWGNSVEVDKLFKLQKRCIRAITKTWFTDSCRPLFKNLRILPLACMYIRSVCLFAMSHPEYFRKLNEVKTRTMRAQYMNLLHQPQCNTYIYEKNVYNMCIKLFNNLPNEIRCLKGKEFKFRLTDWLFDYCFYSVNEFLNYKNIPIIK